MRKTFTITLACCLLVLLTAAPGTGADVRYYLATYDLLLRSSVSGQTVFTTPFIEIENPSTALYGSQGNLTINSIDLPWISVNSISSPVTGVLKFPSINSCSILQSSVTLQPGEGLSINLLGAIEANCLQSCSNTTCTPGSGGCGASCVCLDNGDGTGTCVPLPGTNNPARASVEVKTSSPTGDLAPTVRSKELVHTVVSGALSLMAVKGGEVDSVQNNQ